MDCNPRAALGAGRWLRGVFFGAALRWQILLVMGAAAGVYLPVFRYDFVWDDRTFIVDNPAVHAGAWSAYFTDPSTLSRKVEYRQQIYRPLRTAAFAALWRLSGGDPSWFHGANVVLHCAVTAWLLLWLRTLLPSAAAFAASLLFAVHPVHAEAVSWISSLGDVLYALWFFWALYWWQMGRWRRWVAVFALFPLALLSKEAAIVWPVIAALSGRTEQGAGRRAMLVAAVGIAGAYVAWRGYVLGRMAQLPLTAAALWAALGKVHLIVGEYAAAVMWPVAQCSLRPAVDPAAVSWGAHAVALAVLGGLLWCVARAAVFRANGIVVLSAGFLVALAPVLQFFPLTIDVAERFVYVPSAFLLGAVCAAGHAVVTRWVAVPRRRVAVGWVVVGAVGMWWSAQLIRVNRTWKDAVTVARAQTQCVPLEPGAFWNLAVELGHIGRHAEAVQAYHRLMAMTGVSTKVLDNLSGSWLALREWKKAEILARRSLRIDGNNPRATVNLAVALLGQNRLDAACRLLRDGVRTWPDYAKLHYNLAVCLARSGRWDAARRHARRAAQLDPGNRSAQRLAARLAGR